MMILALWIMAGFFSILIYPHTPGETDIDDGLDLLAIVILWPFALGLAFEARVYEEKSDQFAAHGVAR